MCYAPCCGSRVSVDGCCQVLMVGWGVGEVEWGEEVNVID